MDYGRVLRRAWELTWRWKILWILGFLASLGSGMGSGSNFYQADRGDLRRWSSGQIPEEWLAWGAGALAVLACLALIVGIVVWVVSVIARGGLIAGVQQIEDEGSTTFRQAWRVGRSRFWTLFGISFLAAIPVIILAIVLGIGVAAIVVPIATSQAPGWTEGAIILAVVCGGAFCCGILLVTLVLDQIRIYAERAAILEKLNWIEAFKRGWQVLKEHLGPTIIFWLIFLVIGLAVGGAIALALLIAAAPFIAAFSRTEPGPWVIAPICIGGLLAMIVAGVINGVVQAFTSATWTLVYRQLTDFRTETAVQPSPDL